MSDMGENTGDLKLVGGPSKLKRRVSMHIYILPNMLTTANLFFGFYSIIMSIKGEFVYASYAVVAAAVFDLFDGRLARLTRTTSRFGAEYDSLSDLISFGMAPGLLLYLWALQPFGRVGWVASFLYVACGALRLARFNVQVGVIEKQYFQGLPIPMAAGIVASSVLAFRELGLEAFNSVYILAMTFLLSMVMVSTFRYRSFKDMDLKHRMPFSYLVLGILLFVVVAYNPEVMLFVLFLTYAVLGAVFGLFRLGRKPLKLKSAPEYLEQSQGDLLEEEDDE